MKYVLLQKRLNPKRAVSESKPKNSHITKSIAPPTIETEPVKRRMNPPTRRAPPILETKPVIRRINNPTGIPVSFRQKVPESFPGAMKTEHGYVAPILSVYVFWTCSWCTILLYLNSSNISVSSNSGFGIIHCT